MMKKRILLVEDEIISAKTLERKLIKSGYEVVAIITTGEDVVKNAEKLNPDLILMDINLAGKMDGIEATAKIQAKSDIPVIYITVFDDEKTLQRALITSPFNYLSKPVKDNELCNAIEISLHRFKIEKILKEHEKWFETIIKGVNEAVIITDEKGLIAYMNDKAEDLTGCESEEASGNLHTDILTLKNEQTEEIIESPLLSALKYNITINIPEDTYIISKTGTQNIINGKAMPFKDDNGKPLGAILLIKEITERIKDIRNKKDDLEKKIIERTAELMEEKVERERAEESLHSSEEKYRKIVETSLEGIWLSDIKHRTTFVNKKVADMLGYTAEELMATQLKDHLEGKYKDLIFQEFEKKSTVSGDVKELLFNRKDGYSLWALVSTNILYDDVNKPIGMLSMITDITERKLAEKEILDAKMKAEESSKLKEILIMNLNHELRTPMNCILGFSSMLKDEVRNPDHSEMINYIHSSGNRLMQTLNSIIEFATLESGYTKPKIEDINLNINLQPVLHNFKIEAGKKDLKFVQKIKDENIFVRSDLDMLKTLLSNIIDNAVKYTNEGNVIIEIEKIEEENRHYAQIQIIDSGIGIPKEKQKVIFDEFKQVSEGYGRSFEGIGLGLSISRRITKLLGIKISFKSTYLKGTTFTLKIPALDKDKTKAEKKDGIKIQNVIGDIKPAGKLNQLKEILIVEDNKSNIDLIAAFLRNKYKISYAQTGEKAIEMAAEKQYSLILTDINLGAGIDGIETQKRIREIKGYENIPNIVITGYSSTEDKHKLLNEGFDDFIPKPFTKDMLINSFNKLVPQEKN